MLAAVPLQSATEARSRLKELSDEVALDACEIVLGWERENTNAEECRERIGYAIDAILAGDAPRDTGSLFIDNRWHIVTGGMSWGDAPTDSFDEICLLDTAGICEGGGA